MKQNRISMPTRVGCFLSILILVVDAARIGVSPIQKVIQLMTQLQGQVINEGELAHQSFKTYSEWCEKTSREKQFEISEGKDSKDEVEALLDKSETDASEAEERVEALSGSLASAEQDVKAVTLLRAKAKDDFEKMDRELTSTVSTLSRAQMVLKKELEKAGLKASGTFLQQPTRGMQIFAAAVGELVTTAQGVSAESKERLASLLQLQTGSSATSQSNSGSEEGEDDEQKESEDASDDADLDSEDESEDGAQPYGKPKEAVYKAKSGGIIETLEQMSEEAEQAQADLRKKELHEKHNAEMLKARLEDRIATQSKELEEQKKELAESKEKMATAKGKLDKLAKDLAEDQKYLKKLQQGCMERASEFEMEMATRKDELAALAAAKKTVQAITLTQVPSPVAEDDSATSFLQVDSATEVEAALRSTGAAVATKLKQMAADERSVALAQLSSRVGRALQRVRGSHAADPFEKVKGLIQNMIRKLEKQQANEAAQKKFCDSQMAMTKASKKDREGSLEALTTRIEENVAEIAKLNQQKQTLLGEIGDIEKSQGEMDKMRKDEHASYEKVTQEMNDGLQAVQTALKVLREFYSQDDKSSFIQDMGGAMQASAYQGAGGGTAIISLLEVCESDFSKSLAEAQSEEDAAVDEYEKLTQENKVERAAKDKSVTSIVSAVASLEKRNSEFSGDRTSTQQELDAINEYLEKLTKQCVAQPVSHSERHARREREIKGLEEALNMLDSDSDA
jgi:hypothetical protein